MHGMFVDTGFILISIQYETPNIFSITCTFIPLALAKDTSVLIVINLLDNLHQISTVIINIINSINISLRVTLNISPTKYWEYLFIPPYLDKRTSPNAIDTDENTLIIVSVDAVFLFFI